MSPEIDELRDRVAMVEQKLTGLEEAARLTAAARAVPARFRSVRMRSKSELLGIPLWEVAMGPDFLRGERRGHAKAIFAIGDIATGLVALGGVARGGVCLGGVAMGLVTVGGLSFGFLAAVGGCAVGLGLSVGGLAVGAVAVGGLAVGLLALGGNAVGVLDFGAPLRM